MKTARESGALRIFRYNWPTYVATWTVCLAFGVGSAVWGAVWLTCAFAIPLAWSLASLLVSFYIYDVSHLSAGRWVPECLGATPRRWVSVHAGLDAEVDLNGALSGEGTFIDIFDEEAMHAPSIHRARATTAPAHASLKGTPTSLPVASGSYDAVFAIFTAHEIRTVQAREAFFQEAKRLLAPNGRMLLLEHVQDVANFAAFGPGFLHFQTRREWLRLAQVTNLQVVREERMTPWVMALVLEAPRGS